MSNDYHRSPNNVLRELDVLIYDCFCTNDECMETPKIKRYMHRKGVEIDHIQHMDFRYFVNDTFLLRGIFNKST